MNRNIFEIKVKVLDGTLGIYPHILGEWIITTSEIKLQLDKIKEKTKDVIQKELLKRKKQKIDPMDIVTLSISFKNITTNSDEFTIHTLISTENGNIKAVDKCALWKGEFVDLVM